jgi:hypothetical protein
MFTVSYMLRSLFAFGDADDFKISSRGEGGKRAQEKRLPVGCAFEPKT